MTDRPMAAITHRERLVVAAVLSLAIALLPLVGGGVLWTRPLWLDEICCTLHPVRDASTPIDVIRNVASGDDYAPPGLHLLVWSVSRVAGLSPVALRSISLVCVALALALIYFTLRRRFDWAPSAAGALAVASHSLVLTHAFEARFYGPWLLFAVGFAWSLSNVILSEAAPSVILSREAAPSVILSEAPPSVILSEAPHVILSEAPHVILSEAKDLRERSRRSFAALRMTILAMFSVLLATVHWFGILALGLMAAAVVASRGRDWRSGLRLVAPSAAGVLAFAACLPMMFAHRAGATGADAQWVPELSTAQLTVIWQLFFASTVPVLAATLLAVQVVRSRRTHAAATAGVRADVGDPGFAALASLALFPLILVVVSAVVQPSMLDRYSIVTVLAWAPLVAVATASIGRWGQFASLGFLAVFVGLGTQRTIADRRDHAAVVAATQVAFDSASTMRLPIVFPSVLALYPVAGVARDQSALFLDLPDSTINALVPQPRFHWLRRGITVERNIARGHQRQYGFPKLVTQQQLDTTRRFVLVASDERLPRMYQRVDLFTAAVFPRHRLTRLSPNLALLER